MGQKVGSAGEAAEGICRMNKDNVAALMDRLIALKVEKEQILGELLQTIGDNQSFTYKNEGYIIKLGGVSGSEIVLRKFSLHKVR